MKKLPNSRTILGLALAVAFATTHTARAQQPTSQSVTLPPPPTTQILNRYQQPNVFVPRGFIPAPSYKATMDFARLSHKNNLDVCVNFVAQNCDGHFTRKLVRALSRGARDLVDGNTLAAALRSQGIRNCGHYVGENGGLEMEAFQKGNQLILFSIPSQTEKDPRQAVCKHTVITMPEMIADMKVTQNRAWMIGNSRTVYYAGADFKVRKAPGKTATSMIGVSPDGSKLTVTGATGLFDAQSVTNSDTVGVARAPLGFSDDPRVSDAAADLVPTVNSIRR